MSRATPLFETDDPIDLARVWLSEAEKTEINDPNAMALASVDGDGLPNVRMVLLKEIEDNAFVFYTNYESAKGQELIASEKAAFVLHWKSLQRQVRVRGLVEKEDGAQADAYYASRSLPSRIGAWASEHSRPLTSKSPLMTKVAKLTAEKGLNPSRPPFWGGFRITPLEMEFWADGTARLHDRFRWTRPSATSSWTSNRLNP